MNIEIIEISKRKVKPVELDSKSYYDSENIKYFTIPELSRLFDGIDDYFYQMIFLFLFESGARIDEARQVKFSDIDFFTKKIRIKTLKQRKKNIYRGEPLTLATSRQPCVHISFVLSIIYRYCYFKFFNLWHFCV